MGGKGECLLLIIRIIFVEEEKMCEVRIFYIYLFDEDFF